MEIKKVKRSSKPRFDINEYLNKRSGKIVVMGLAERVESNKFWSLNCLCDCGKTITVRPYQFRNGAIRSCGCEKLKPHHITHNHSKDKMFGTWKQMLERCENPKSYSFHHYGGRGISVCKEWHEFEVFDEWVKSIGGRKDGYTLDRIDTDGNYCPENCRFVPWNVQALNKRSSHKIEYKGVSKSLKEWAEEIGMTYYVLEHRINRGWDVERAIETPVQKKSK